MEAITLPIYNSEGKEVGSYKLNSGVFDGVINTDAIHQAVTAYLAMQRRGSAATKTRGEVSGGGVKPWRQKGTGRARVGSSRTPLWRHGGVIFGPHPRSFEYILPIKIRRLALRSALNAKLKDKDLIIIDTLNLSSAKTKEAAKVFSNLKLSPGKKQKDNWLIFLFDKPEENMKRAMRNIGALSIYRAEDTNAYQILSHRKVLITKSGLDRLTERLK